MTDQVDEKFEQILARTRQVMADRNKRAEELRRAALSPLELANEARMLWQVHRETLVRNIKSWDNRLIETGVRIRIDAERLTHEQIIEKNLVKVLVGDQTGPDLHINIVSGIRPYLTYSGPRGTVINGDTGRLDIDTIPADALDHIVLRHLAQRIG